MSTADQIVMSIETYEKALYDAEVYIKLKESELEMQSVAPLKTHDEVFEKLYSHYKLAGSN